MKPRSQFRITTIKPREKGVRIMVSTARPRERGVRIRVGVVK